MWRRVALSSKETLEQLISYQAAIEALNVGTIMTKKVYTVMVNNSININKTNNQLTSQTIKHKKAMHDMALESQVLD